MARAQGDSVVGVYMLHNQETGEAYIGSGVLNKRRVQHFCQLRRNTHGNSLLQDAYNRNSNFEFIGLEVDGESREEARRSALRLEAKLVSEQVDNPFLLNLMRECIDSRMKLSHNEETVANIRARLIEKWQDPQWREKTLAAQNAGRASMSPEAREVAARNRATALKEAYETGQRGSIKGQTRSDAFKAHNSQMISEKWSEPEYRAKQMAARTKGVYRDTEMAKPVEIEGVAYSTVSAAARAHGMTKQGVGYRLKTRTFPNWNYVEKK